METKLLTVNDIAEILHCSKRGVYQLLKKQDIPKIKIGRHYLFPADELANWIHMNCENVQPDTKRKGGDVYGVSANVR